MLRIELSPDKKRATGVIYVDEKGEEIFQPAEMLFSCTFVINNARMRQLDEVGDNNLSIPACGNCHGLRGRGEGVMLPPLAGQPSANLVSQLNAFRTQQRQNDTVEIMEGSASRLSSQDIDAVAHYFMRPLRSEAAATP